MVCPDPQIEVTDGQLVCVPFSTESAYMSGADDVLETLNNRIIPDCTSSTETEEISMGHDMRYIGAARELHLSEETDNDILPMVRRELAGIFHRTTSDFLRVDPGEYGFTWKWKPEVGISRFGRERSVLPLDFFLHRNPDESASGQVQEFFNKHIAVYLEKGHKAQTPPFQRGHFLAKPIQFGEGRSFPGRIDEVRETTLHEVFTFHKSLCDGVSARENDVMKLKRPPRRTRASQVSDHDLKYYSYYCPGSPDPVVGFRLFLDPSPMLTWRQQGFRLGHLFTSLVMLADDRGSPGNQEDCEPWDRTKYCLKTPPGRYKKLRSAETDAERQCEYRVSGYRVLLMRTGDESHLSAPISFQTLFDAGKVLPLERPDISCSSLSFDDVVRVHLPDALEFITALIRREEDALPHSVGHEADALQDEVSQLCEEWIERVLKHADVAGGLENNAYTRQALGRARARLNGEAFDFERLPPDGLVHSWYN